MANGLCERDRDVKNEVIQMCWMYLKSNFSKFSDGNKLKVSLAIVSKNMPQEVNQVVQVNQLPAVKINDSELEFDVGEYISSRITQDS